MTIRLRDLGLGVALLALGWIVVLALVLRFGGPAPAVLVLFPSAGLLDALPPEMAITARGTFGLIARGGPGLVPALYDAGALLVLPAGLAGCLGL